MGTMTDSSVACATSSTRMPEKLIFERISPPAAMVVVHTTSALARIFCCISISFCRCFLRASCSAWRSTSPDSPNLPLPLPKLLPPLLEPWARLKGVAHNESRSWSSWSESAVSRPFFFFSWSEAGASLPFFLLLRPSESLEADRDLLEARFSFSETRSAAAFTPLSRSSLAALSFSLASKLSKVRSSRLVRTFSGRPKRTTRTPAFWRPVAMLSTATLLSEEASNGAALIVLAIIRKTWTDTWVLPVPGGPWTMVQVRIKEFRTAARWDLFRSSSSPTCLSTFSNMLTSNTSFGASAAILLARVSRFASGL
mmetsp:Transcript_4071/g.11304  ORF Transcript_4071/g.11304 Transcript_4071/m.11304 type:complete len:312 (+) Transcript_4071:294-1229(+)